MSVRRSSYRSLASLRRDLARCRACVEAGYPLESWPVRAPALGQRAYLYGQAPGIVEGEERLPWRGRAGQTLRRWLRLSGDELYETFYCASVTRCYPGRPAGGRGDRTPTPREQELCQFWRDWELELLRPELIVTVGGLALKRLLRLPTLTEAIGKSYTREGAIVIPLPHPSGASGWLNDAANRARLGKALTHVRRELARLDATEVRILFSFTAGYGHLEPLLPIACAAASAGHDVAVAGGHGPVEAIAETGLRTFPLGPRPTGPRRRRPLLDVDVERERNDVRERFFRHHAANRARDVRSVFEEWHPDVVVCDEMDYGAVLAAELLDRPYATVLVNASGSMITADVVAEPLDELRAGHGLPPVPLEAWLGRHLVLSPFPPSLPEPKLLLPAQAVPFRAIDVERPGGEPPWPVSRPGAPAVYFTLGTEFNVESGDLFARVLAGLRDLPLDVVATVGSDIEPAELGPQPAHVHVAQFIPQRLVLPHCAAVVSHAGSGSILGALTHGLPQVLIAMGADQPLNAARCTELGLAVTLDPVAATPDDVRAAVATVLDEPSYRRAADQIRDEIGTLPDPEHAVTALEEVVARFRG